MNVRNENKTTEETKEDFDLKDIIAFIIAVFIHLLPITLFLIFLIIIYFILVFIVFK